MLITEILADMTKEETKAQGFTILSEFRKEWSKITKHLIDLEETTTAHEFRNTEKQQDRVQNHERQKKQLKKMRRLSKTAVLANAKNPNTALNATVSTITNPTSQRWSHFNSY